MQPVISGFQGEYRWLSNFWSTKHEPGIKLALPSGLLPFAESTEHLYQAAKADDQYNAWAILKAEAPDSAKRMGALVKKRDDWDKVKVPIMLELQTYKFFRNPSLRERLLETGDALIVETNNWCDTFWGRCVCEIHNNEGQNCLGQIIMLVRSILQAEQENVKGSPEGSL